IHGKHHLVGVPVGEKVHRRGNDEGNDHAHLAADKITDPHEQGGHRGKQHGCTKITHRTHSNSAGKASPRFTVNMLEALPGLTSIESSRRSRWFRRGSHVRLASRLP